jgi:ADP-ribose pyrophosphatase YjhB (NUDIX family)
MEPIIRVAGVLVEDACILLVEQDVTESRHWAQPGGKLEPGESLERGLIREMKEETGLDVQVDELLYIAERITNESHIVIISFMVRQIGGILGTGTGIEFAEGKIKRVKMIPISQLSELGFSATYCALARAGFPERGTYKGDIFYREEMSKSQKQ